MNLVFSAEYLATKKSPELGTAKRRKLKRQGNQKSVQDDDTCFIECFKGGHRGGAAILPHFCGSPDPPLCAVK